MDIGHWCSGEWSNVQCHLANAKETVLRASCLWPVAGGRWLDLDETCLGPPEWDLACLRHRSLFFGELTRETSDALEAYGPHDEQAVAALDPLVVLFTAAWGSMATSVGKPIGPRTQQRLNWLRERYAR